MPLTIPTTPHKPTRREQHEAVAAWFLGPKAENFDFLQKRFEEVLATQRQTRLCYFPDDEVAITSDVRGSQSFKDSQEKLKDSFGSLLHLLDKYSVPFFSPRYSAHMCMENSIPSILGYLSTMLFNPNNVAFEASPVTTLLELEVGQQLCEMLGFSIDSNPPNQAVGWGHVTCDGTVANLESIWAARNLKFYPLAFKKAIADGAPLAFIADTFDISTCKGATKLFKDLDCWELLNLDVDAILNIPPRLYEQYEISQPFLEATMKKYTIQSVGKDALQQEFGITNPPQFFACRTRHYSWPKGAAIAGIGADNLVNVEVDTDARLDIKVLERLLLERVQHRQAVYAVVAVIGSTEEGAVDPLDEILALRKKFQKEHGLSFVVHADAAWGGYFASMIRHTPHSPRSDTDGFVPTDCLRKSTIKQFEQLGSTDSITIDPHKAAYIPYPAGALCYRNGRMKDLLTWTAPYLSQGEGESIGIYGVEGSKPGASATSVWLSHQVIHLNDQGLGSLLGEVSFTCRRFASHWSAMSDEKTDFIVVPFNPLPAEREPNHTSKDIENQKEFIRQRILNVENSELVKDRDAFHLLHQLGSDLNINAFACNFRIDGKVNTDIQEANYLNRRIFERLSITIPHEDPKTIPFYVTSTVFTEEEYGECATHFKKRLGLEGDGDLVVLRNVVMSPFSTTRNFVADLAKTFQKVLEEEIGVVRRRDAISPDFHEFIVQGTKKRKYLVYRPRFQKFNDCFQVILSADIDYTREDQNATIILTNKTEATLDELLHNGFEGYLTVGGEKRDVHVSNVQVIKKSSLNFNDRSVGYPESFMPFYLYGTPDELHISHLIVFDPNIQLCGAEVSINSTDSQLSADDLQKGLIVKADGLHEHSMLPFPPNDKLPKSEKFFFSPGKKFNVSIIKDPYPAIIEGTVKLSDIEKQSKIGTGTLTIGRNVFIDNDRINEDPWKFASTASGRMNEETKGQWKEVVRGVCGN